MKIKYPIIIWIESIIDNNIQKFCKDNADVFSNLIADNLAEALEIGLYQTSFSLKKKDSYLKERENIINKATNNEIEHYEIEQFYNKKYIRCLHCSTEYSRKESEGISSCAKCGSKSVPCLIDDDVNIRINWHELRILTIWAENWARQIDDKEEDNGKDKLLLTIMTIAERLQNQFPTRIPLTMFSEMRELRNSLEGTGTNIITDLDNDGKLGL